MRTAALALLIWGFSAQALELEYLSQSSLSYKMKFKKTKIGGLSGLYRDLTQENIYFAVSDDRGNLNEPRVYELKVSVGPGALQVEPKDVIFLSVNETSFSHSRQKSKSKLFSKVLDLEGVSMTPWGDFLLINEGDMNKKPRVPPQIFSVKKDGTIQRDYAVPNAFLPEAAGAQAKGVRNNSSFEGLAVNSNGKEWIVATEGPLIQDPKDFVRFIQYQMPEAWVLKPQKEFHYPISFGRDLENAESKVAQNSQRMELQKGVSEILFIDQSRLLVIERALVVSPKGMSFQVQLFETDLTSAGKDLLLSKRLVLDLADLSLKVGKVENFEGMTLGPKLSDGRRSLILVSDDNFMRDQRTLFLLFAIKE